MCPLALWAAASLFGGLAFSHPGGLSTGGASRLFRELLFHCRPEPAAFHFLVRLRSCLVHALAVSASTFDCGRAAGSPCGHAGTQCSRRVCFGSWPTATAFSRPPLRDCSHGGAFAPFTGGRGGTYTGYVVDCNSKRSPGCCLGGLLPANQCDFGVV